MSVLGRWALPPLLATAVSACGPEPAQGGAGAIGVAALDLTTTPTSSMSEPHELHTATRLHDGRVLVAGGDHGVTSATAEIYDPAVGTWSLAAPLHTPRTRAVAVLLRDHRVFVAGGGNEMGVLDTVEIYDPATDTWTFAAPMSVPRTYTVAVLLEDGRVLVAGGSPGLPPPPPMGPPNPGPDPRSALAEIYDPGTDTWTETGSLTTPRIDHVAARLGDGRVLVAGGGDGAVELDDGEVYDPATGTWSPTEPLHQGKVDATATRLRDGRVLAVGGGANDVGGDGERYRPNANRWARTGVFSLPRAYHAAARLPGGRVLIAGGVFPDGYEASLEVYDPTADTWASAGSMSVPRAFHTATRLKTGEILLAGGVDGTTGNMLATAELFGDAGGGADADP